MLTGQLVKIILSVQDNFCRTFATVRRTFGMTVSVISQFLIHSCWPTNLSPCNMLFSYLIVMIFQWFMIFMITALQTLHQLQEVIKRQIAQQQTTGKTSHLYQETFENVKSCHLSWKLTIWTIWIQISFDLLFIMFFLQVPTSYKSIDTSYKMWITRNIYRMQ